MGRGPKYFPLKSFTGQPSQPRFFALVAFDNNLVGVLKLVPKEHWKSATDLRNPGVANSGRVAIATAGGLTQVFFLFLTCAEVSRDVYVHKSLY